VADDKERRSGVESEKWGGTEEVTRVKRVATRRAPRIERNSLVLLQKNCRSVLNKSSDFWNLIDTYNFDVIIGFL
jgi:hypothetical protein